MNEVFFPIGMNAHIILSLAALLVFGLQFVRFRKPRFLILAVILPITMIPHFVNSRLLFNIIGVIEAVCLAVVCILYITDSIKDRKAGKKASIPEEEEIQSAAEDAQA